MNCTAHRHRHCSRRAVRSTLTPVPSRWGCARVPCWRRPRSCCGAPAPRRSISRYGDPSSPMSRSSWPRPRARARWIETRGAAATGEGVVKTHVRVVVIGGGVVGVSTLYHLTKKGWTDVALLERTELTAGSTWHAAGLLPLFNMSYTVGQLHKYSVDLYKRLPEETGQDVSFHVTGNLRLATSPRAHGRVPEVLRHGEHHRRAVPGHQPAAGQGAVAAGRARRRRRHPRDRRRALSPRRRPHRPRRPDHGAAQGRAQRRRRDLRTHRGQRPRAHAIGRVEAPHQQGRHHLRARGAARPAITRGRPGGMLGLNVPAIPVEHQYIVYDESPELKAYRQGGGRELAVLRESDKSYYLREERMGWILGPYEQGAPARFADGVPEWFGRRLFRGRPRPAAAARRGGAAPRAGTRALRHQGHRQRTDLLHARTAAR